MIDGKQRLHNIRTKVRIVAERELRQFMAGELKILPCSGDRFEHEIVREFDRITEKRECAA